MRSETYHERIDDRDLSLVICCNTRDDAWQRLERVSFELLSVLDYTAHHYGDDVLADFIADLQHEMDAIDRKYALPATREAHE